MKLHISLKVDDLEQAIDFYSRLFKLDPVIRKDDYVKWDVVDPAVNFVIEAGGSQTGVDHFGIQVESDTDLDVLADRLRDSGQPYQDIASTTCCFAKMDKAWIKGMAGEKWEVFLTHSQDEQEYGKDRSECCVDSRNPEQKCCPIANEDRI